MDKITGIVMLCFAFAVGAYMLLSWEQREDVKVNCVDGYAFATVAAWYSGGVTQIWENGPNGPRPMMCGGKEGGEGNE